MTLCELTIRGVKIKTSRSDEHPLHGTLFPSECTGAIGNVTFGGPDDIISWQEEDTVTATPLKQHLRNVPSSPHLLKFGLMGLPGVQGVPAQWAEAGSLSSEFGDIEYWAMVAMLTLAIVGIAATL
jgi:hypothetical protein